MKHRTWQYFLDAIVCILDLFNFNYHDITEGCMAVPALVDMPKAESLKN